MSSLAPKTLVRMQMEGSLLGLALSGYGCLLFGAEPMEGLYALRIVFDVTLLLFSGFLLKYKRQRFSPANGDDVVLDDAYVIGTTLNQVAKPRCLKTHTSHQEVRSA